MENGACTKGRVTQYPMLKVVIIQDEFSRLSKCDATVSWVAHTREVSALANKMPCDCQDNKELKSKGVLAVISAYRKVLQSAIMRISDRTLSWEHPLRFVILSNKMNQTLFLLADGFSRLKPYCCSKNGHGEFEGWKEARGTKEKNRTTDSSLPGWPLMIPSAQKKIKKIKKFVA
jgi:hypothetical protein